MNDDRIGTHGQPKPKLTIGGNPVGEQYRCMIGIGNQHYVIVGYHDHNYQAEIEKLKASISKPVVRVHKKGAMDE